MIEINGLTKKFGDLVATDNLTVKIETGKIFALLGVNGSGKSTTIKMLSCLIVPTSGNAKIDGFDLLKNQEEIKKIINVSPQETAVAQNLTVYQNLEFIAEIYGLDKLVVSQKVDGMLKKFDLENVKNKRAKLLSGGMMRRLSISMALITEPKVLFLDEPTLGVDVIERRKIWDTIKGLKGNTTVILTTHYMEEAEALADEIGIMARGKMIITGTAKELIKKSGAKNFEDAFVFFATEGNGKI